VLPTESEHSRHLRDVVCNHLSLSINPLANHQQKLPNLTKMAPPAVIASFLSVQPLEPVLVFNSAEDAANFQTHYCKQGRIFPDQRTRVYLPMPEGLLRVRTARNGDTGYDFDTARHASAFNDSIMALGRVFQSTTSNPGWDRSVYLGKQLR
jgi:hypothetical protein